MIFSAKLPILIRSRWQRCFLVLAASLPLLYSCKTTRPATEVKRPLIERKVDTLVQKLDSARFGFEWFSAKISATVNTDNKTNSFSATLRMRKDSIIWISISSLGIEAARAVVTPDSFKLVDRLNAKYLAGDLEYINKLLDVAADFNIFQHLLVGNYAPYLDEKKLRSSYVDEPYYILSTLRRRKLKRALEEKDPNKRIIQDVWLDPKTFRVVKLSVEDTKTKRKMLVNYENFEAVAPENGGSPGKLLPRTMTITIDSKKPVQIVFDYTKPVVDTPFEFPFSIPEKYTKM